MPRRVSCAAVALLLGLAAVAGAAEPAKGGKATVQKSDYGKLADGTAIDLYTLTNAHGLVCKVITFGGIVTELHAPDKDGKMADVVLGCPDLKTYEAGHPFFGAIAGRVANRIANATFTLDGHTYKLEANNGPHSLHGGKKGFDKHAWHGEPAGGASVRLSRTSPDGEEGYPGNLKVTVTYTLTDNDELRIDYEATTDKATPVNLTNHSYFNLAGHDSGTIDEQVLMIAAEKYTPWDATLIPSGKIEPVKGTPFDFTKPTAIGSRYKELKDKPVGYDLNYVLDAKGKLSELAARARDPKSGRVLEMYTTEPGVQFYTSNFIDKQKGKGGATYARHAAFCLEAQHYPDSVHKENFPSVILKPGDTYRQTTVYKFSAEKWRPGGARGGVTHRPPPPAAPGAVS
jgi:aldose 1-epimerase